MTVPYMGGALKGWVQTTNITVVTQSVVDHETVEAESNVSFPANFQPLPAEKVNRKPEEQRTWKWWSVIIQDKTVYFSTDDIIQDDSGQKFRIEQANDWRKSGFTKYEVVEDYT